ncbi:MAG: hypothetical protein IJH53_01410 [Oscillospiraceae bacterium]|nr:hypothetical protein [Oscillospiraceae bacterium]
MKKITDSRLFWLLTSLLISLVIWIYVTSLQSDEYRQVFRNVPVEFVGTASLRSSKGMEITDADVSTVTVEISGPRRIIGAWDSSDLVAQIDVSKLSQSIYTSQQYSVAFPEGTDTSNISVIRRYPETVTFTVSNVIDKTVQVKGSFLGEIEEGYIAQKAEFEPSTITLTGPETYLKNVEYVWVTFGDGEINSTYSVETGFVLMDAEGSEYSTAGITFSSDTVVATLPILAVKEVPLDVNLIYGAGSNDSNTIVDIQPKTITLSGDSAILADVNKIVLASIDTTSFSSTNQYSFPIKISNELNNITGLTEAEVSVEIIGLETKTFNVQNIHVTNAPAGFTATAINQQLVVKIRGTKDELDRIVSENITAVADLSDISATAGYFDVPVKIRIDGSNDAGAIGTYNVSVSLVKD